jgi:hypothetical protein
VTAILRLNTALVCESSWFASVDVLRTNWIIICGTTNARKKILSLRETHKSQDWKLILNYKNFLEFKLKISQIVNKVNNFIFILILLRSTFQ